LPVGGLGVAFKVDETTGGVMREGGEGGHLVF